MGYLSLSLWSELNSSYMSSALRSVLRVICCVMKRTSTTKQEMTAAAASRPTMYCHHTVITSPGDNYDCPGQLEPNTTAVSSCRRRADWRNTACELAGG